MVKLITVLPLCYISYIRLPNPFCYSYLLRLRFHYFQHSCKKATCFCCIFGNQWIIVFVLGHSITSIQPVSAVQCICIHQILFSTLMLQWNMYLSIHLPLLSCDCKITQLHWVPQWPCLSQTWLLTQQWKFLVSNNSMLRPSFPLKYSLVLRVKQVLLCPCNWTWPWNQKKWPWFSGMI